MKRTVRRGDIYYAKLDPHIGSEQGGTRPVLILSNDTGNRFSPTVIVAAITSRVRKKTKLPCRHITIWKMLMGFPKIQLFSLNRCARLTKAVSKRR